MVERENAENYIIDMYKEACRLAKEESYDPQKHREQIALQLKKFDMHVIKLTGYSKHDLI